MTEELDNIPQANEILYTLKLITGEELLCTVIDMEDEYMVIESPISVKQIPILTETGTFVNKYNYSSWLPFSANRIFHIPFGTILTYSSLSSELHELYVTLVNGFESVSVDRHPDSFIVDSNSTIH